ncbi:MAG: diaminopimelate epimerase [Acidimicrobiia bacterium]
MRFTKMEGLGNDFVVIDGSIHVDPPLVRRLSDRRRGVGADGVLQVEVADGAISMGYWNADGTAAEMCGNGLRCVARYARDHGLASTDDFTVVTAMGERHVTVAGNEPMAEIGPVSVGAGFEFEGWTFQAIEVGNPHAVAFIQDPAVAPVRELGAELERLTPGGINVEFVSVIDRHKVEMRVWERGVGETLACGSGMVAAVAAGQHLGMTDNEVIVRVPGGEGLVRLEANTSWLSGPVRYVFTGQIEL